MSALLSSLSSFREQVNANARLRTLLKGWDRVILVEATDTGEKFKVLFQDTKITDVVMEPAHVEADISLKAAETTLSKVFDGRENPATLFLDGVLQVFASDKDQVRLDAIALILWD